MKSLDMRTAHGWMTFKVETPFISGRPTDVQSATIWTDDKGVFSSVAWASSEFGPQVKPYVGATLYYDTPASEDTQYSFETGRASRTLFSWTIYTEEQAQSLISEVRNFLAKLEAAAAKCWPETAVLR